VEVETNDISETEYGEVDIYRSTVVREFYGVNRKMRLVRCRSSVILHCDFSANLTHPCAISGSLFFSELQFLNFYRCQTNRNSDYFGVQSRYFSFVLYIKSFIHTLNRYLQLSLAVVKHFQTQTIHSENRLDHLEHFLFG